jgi:hypothetical protein
MTGCRRPTTGRVPASGEKPIAIDRRATGPRRRDRHRRRNVDRCSHCRVAPRRRGADPLRPDATGPRGHRGRTDLGPAVRLWYWRISGTACADGLRPAFVIPRVSGRSTVGCRDDRKRGAAVAPRRRLRAIQTSPSRSCPYESGPAQCDRRLVVRYDERIWLRTTTLGDPAVALSAASASPRQPRV